MIGSRCGRWRDWASVTQLFEFEGSISFRTPVDETRRSIETVRSPGWRSSGTTVEATNESCPIKQARLRAPAHEPESIIHP